MSDDFHVYGVDWDSTGMRWWLDDPSNVTTTVTAEYIEQTLGSTWVYNQPFFLILNLAVGGDWPGSPDVTTQFPAEMVVDYVRVSQSPGDGQLVTDGFDADPRDVQVTLDVPATVSHGAAAELGIDVTGLANPRPSGTVTVHVGGREHEVRLTSGRAVFPLPALATGRHDVRVTFTDPSSALRDAEAGTSFEVVRANSTLEVDLGGDTVVGSTPVTAVVRVLVDGTTRPTGAVTVELEPGVTASVHLRAHDQGVAIVRLPARKSAGSVTATVTYAGDSNVAGSAATAVHRATAPVTGDLYETPGVHFVNGRFWSTTCEPYSQTVRCRTEIWSTQVGLVGGKVVSTTGWHFNNLTYLPQMTEQQWAGNPLGHAGQWESNGRHWKTECHTPETGRGGCRSWIWTHYVTSERDTAGTWTRRAMSGWVFNNIVRFG